MEKETITISEEEAGSRLDRVLFNRFEPQFSRSYFQSLIQEGQVLLNGAQVKKHIRPESGDAVDVLFRFPPEVHIKPEEIPLEILYEDNHILVVNKPAQMVVHPAPGNWTGTFVNAFVHHCKMERQEGDIRPGIVHRLDKETSGVLIAAKSLEIQHQLSAQFANREVEKEYLAICVGSVGDVTLNQPIARHPIKRKQMTVSDKGRAAITHCKTLHYNLALSVVQIRLETGRTHQIRVHLQHHHTPVLGDSLYGSLSANQKYHAKRQMLHAHRLTVTHPKGGERLSFEAPVPEDIQAFINKIQCGDRSGHSQ